ncbi:MAG: multiprotein-bridging factor 1 family protein [Hadesarchaea archaeon]|nr:multiprotein-bridging factor 1 family protein [Hadesarchaea archaeon]
MECEVCGVEITGEPCRVLIDGAVMLVCERCSGIGRKLEGVERRLTIEPWLDMPELVEDYPKRIRQARERLGLTQEELAKRLAERASVVKRLEAGTLVPNEQLVKKIHRVLGIRLIE